MYNTKILTYWEPQIDLADHSEVNEMRLWVQFDALLKELKFPVDTQSIHSPVSMAKWAVEKTSHWHQDCGQQDALFIVWSNIQPTEFIFFGDRKIMEVGERAVILVDNLEGLHRTPTPLHADRWLARSNYIARDLFQKKLLGE